MNIEPGDAFAIKINSHRHQWNGSICSSPEQWSCGANTDFRASYCASGRDRCFHLNVFNPGAPRIKIPDRSVVELIEQNPDLLNDQVLFFAGQKFDARTGRHDEVYDQTLYGVYRIKSTTIERNGHVANVIVEPYPEDWAVFPRNQVRKPATPNAFDGVSYLSRVSNLAATQSIDAAIDAAKTMTGADALSPSLLKRLERAGRLIGQWLENAKKCLDPDEVVLPQRSFSVRVVSAPQIESALAGQLKEALVDKPMTFRPAPATLEENGDHGDGDTAVIADTDAPVGNAGAPSALLPDSGWTRAVLPESSCASIIEREYGEDTVNAIRIGSITKALLLLAGLPGAGKSTLAPALIDDDERERSIIVPVASTWRGKEDLLGHVNPVTREFEQTDFTRFLRRAEAAWRRGDRRPQLAVFEEFNLSQPEHWLSELLVRLEYDASRIADRTLNLGGECFAGEKGSSTAVYLPPTLILVGTLNNDHTVRPLTPRVLDRSALIQLSTTGREALARVGIEGLPATLVDAVDELNDVLATRGVAFSVRSALSLRRAMAALGKDQVHSIMDHVIVQEVLSKVQLMANDPQDSALLEQLQSWGEREACVQLPMSRSRIEAWQQTLQSGRDVFQA